MSRTKASKDGAPPRWVRPEAVPTLVQLGQLYGGLRRQLDAAQSAFLSAQAVPLFYPPDGPLVITRQSPAFIAQRLDTCRDLLPDPTDFGPASLFALLCGEPPFAVGRAIARYEAAVLRELGPDGFELVRHHVELLRQRRRHGWDYTPENSEVPS